MIILLSTKETKAVFEKLINTINARVSWDGLFIVHENFFILHGQERSLVFNFDTRKVYVDILDYQIRNNDVVNLSDNITLVNCINMLLYAFGKWESIKGVKVEQNYKQLNALFEKVLKEASIVPDYNKEHFYFYNEGVRLSYEDVINAIIITSLNFNDEKNSDEERSESLWYSMEWKWTEKNLSLKRLNLQDLKKERSGDNYYKIGYLCPECGRHLYMTVYRRGNEFIIDTDRGRVKLARACVCTNCGVFYTPEPDYLLSEGRLFCLMLKDNRAVFEDYKELTGRNGEKTHNSNFNVYIDANNPFTKKSPSEKNEELTQEEISERDNDIFLSMIEEGFYSEEKKDLMQKKINDAWEKKERRDKLPDAEKGENIKGEKERNREKKRNQKADKKSNINKSHKAGKKNNINKSQEADEKSNINSDQKTSGVIEKNKIDRQANENRENLEGIRKTGFYAEGKNKGQTLRQYDINQDELEENVKRDNRNDNEDISSDRKENEKIPDIRSQKENFELYKKLIVANHGRTYNALKRLFDEITSAKLNNDDINKLHEQLKENMKEQGKKEAKSLVAALPPSPDRKTLKQIKEKILEYKEADCGEELKEIERYEEGAQRKEAEELIKNSKKTNRRELLGLKEQIRTQNFDKSIEQEYEKRIDDAIEKIDMQRIESAFAHFDEMTGEELDNLYDMIKDEEFLPSIKSDSLKRIERKLIKIKAQECELLVLRLKKELDDEKVSNNDRHYFYPAKKVLNNVESEEADAINYSKSVYAIGIGQFEYPIFMVDSSKSNSGKEGFILTPERLYVGGLVNCNSIDVLDISNIDAVSRMFSKKIYIHTNDGDKYKLPYMVSTKEIEGFTRAIGKFVQYLKEKPFSRKEKYLSKDKHETICCFRCGFVYKSEEICPKCGYKLNI